MIDALVISDIHLGSSICQSSLLDLFLHNIITGEFKIKELILNGDVFDSWDFRRLKKSHWKILSDLRHISKTVKVTWIVGNHDGPAEVVSHLIGVNVVESYAIVSGSKKIFLIHGHCFDSFITDHPIITEIADCVY